MDKKEQLTKAFQVIESLCRDDGVWEWLWQILIDDFNVDRDKFFTRISAPFKPFDSQSINRRIERIKIFMDENIENVYYDTNLNYPEEIFEDQSFSGEEFFEELLEYFSQRLNGIENLIHYLIRYMASENTYSYIDENNGNEDSPHFDFYKEDLSVVLLKK